MKGQVVGHESSLLWRQILAFKEFSIAGNDLFVGAYGANEVRMDECQRRRVGILAARDVERENVEFEDATAEELVNRTPWRTFTSDPPRLAVQP
jgi:hypothetical protein